MKTKIALTALVAFASIPALAETWSPDDFDLLDYKGGVTADASVGLAKFSPETGTLGGGIGRLGYAWRDSVYDPANNNAYVSVGAFFGSSKVSDSATYAGTTYAYSYKADSNAQAVLVGYTRSFGDENLRPYVGVQGGFVHFGAEANDVAVTGLGKVTAETSGFAPAVGVTSGVAYRVNERTMLRVGYEFLRVMPYDRKTTVNTGLGGTKFNDRIDGQNAHIVTVGATWSF